MHRNLHTIYGLAALAATGLLSAPDIPEPIADESPRKPRRLKRPLLAERENVTYVTSPKPLSKRAKRRARGKSGSAQ